MATHPIEKMATVIRHVGSDIQVNAKDVVWEVVRQVHDQLLDQTPVDTGTARSNWIVSTGVPANFSILPYNPYPKFSHRGRSERANFRAAAQQRELALAGRQSGEKVFIVNNVLYIGDLAGGTSPQNKNAGWVRRAVERGARVGLRVSLLRARREKER